MADPVWIDGSTPLNSVNMTKLQTRDEKGAPSGYVGLDSGSNANVAGVFASGYGGARQVTLSSSVIPSGYAGVAFGSTGDTNLYRAAVNDLRTDGSFMAGTHVQSAGGGANRIMLNADGHIYFGGAADTSLYRSAVGTLRSNGPYFAITHDAGRVFFGTADDVSIGRAAAGQVSVTGMLTASGLLSSQNPSANQIILGGSSAPTIFFGSAQDTNLYRVVAGFLKTDGHFQAAQNIYVNLSDAANGGIIFGSAGDTNLYRSAAGILTTGNAFSVGSYIQVAGPMWSTDSTGDPWKGLLFGSAQDTKLYRSSAGTLSTPGSLNIGGPSTFGGGYFYLNDSFAIDGNTPVLSKYGPLQFAMNSTLRLNGGLYVDLAGATNRLYFGASADASIWRIGAGQLGVDALQIQGTYTVGVGSCNLAIGSNRGSGNVTNWVEIGAPDSGGSGYRMLRVPN